MRKLAGFELFVLLLLVFTTPSATAFLAPIPNVVPQMPRALQSSLKRSAPSAHLLRAFGDNAAAVGEYAQAESLYRQALALLPPQSGEAGHLHDRIAQTHARRLEYAFAESEWFKAFQILVSTSGSGSPTVAVVLENMGWANEQLNRMDVAKVCYEKAIVIQAKTGAPEFLRATTMRALAKIYLRQKQFRRAERLFKQADSLMVH
jgi:tetratricopeptide (TPR) repeat protein